MSVLQYCMLLTLFCAVMSAPAAPEQSTIIKYVNDNDGSGNYFFSYETSDGISREETGRVVNKGEKDQYLIIKGRYSYIDTNGKRITVQYTGDENGYHLAPQLQLPVVEAVPANVVASLLGK